MNKKDRAVEGPEDREAKTTAKNQGQTAPPRSFAKTLCQQLVNFKCTSIVSRWCKQVQCGKLTISDFADVFVATASKR